MDKLFKKKSYSKESMYKDSKEPYLKNEVEVE